jgi:hypothetical protein
MQQIDRMIEQAPPPAGHRGFHFYWEQPSSDTDPLNALVQRSNAWKIAISLVAPRNLEPPEQIQVSLNIPVWHHQPGGPHIDGPNGDRAERAPGDIHITRRHLPYRSDGEGHGQSLGLAWFAQCCCGLPPSSRGQRTL